MEGDWNSPFPKFQATTRPDKVASGIVEGRVAVVFDNSPEVILAPANFNTLLQASDDYYNRWTVGSFSRILRYIALFVAVGMPGLYIALTVHHSELLPTKLLFAIVNARYMVTFSVITEVLIMELFFELLREAGIRLPGPLGNTIGVVGGLIVGQAAVEAGIVSTIVVIVVALTAISSFAIPNEVFASVFRLLKFWIIFTSAMWGLYGFWLGLMAIFIHLSGLNSFGQPYMLPGINGENVDNDLDYVVKAPIDKLVKRPIWANAENKVRLRKK
jgi:spore germination protein